MSNIEEKPLHEVILDIMYFKNKEKPFPYSPDDIFWQMKDPNISERQIKEVLEWLVVNKRVEKRFGKYQIDKYEFIDLANKYKDEPEADIETKSISKPSPTRIEVVKKVSVAKKKQPQLHKKLKNNRSVYKIYNLSFIILSLVILIYIGYTLYNNTPKYIVPLEGFTEAQILDTPNNLYVSTDKLSEESKEIQSKFQAISYSFVKQNKINGGVVDNINDIKNEIRTLKKEFCKLNEFYIAEIKYTQTLLISFFFLFLLFILFISILTYRK